jgi:hypothetical protein
MGLGDFKNDLAIRIGALFTGAGAFKNASNAVTKLDKSIKFLAKSYAGLFVVQKAVAFGKASLTEYGKNQTAVQKLTREVTNLGQAFELTSINNYLDSLEKTFAVQKEQLRPAFQELMRVTKSYAVSQKLLKTGLDVSAGSGEALSTVIGDLNQAYVGNLKGLQKYRLGLTNAELAAMSFQEITALLAKTFKGQAALAADSFAGKMAALTIASDNAKETIGKGLVTALQSIVGEDKGIKDATNAIDNMSSSISLAIIEMGKLIGKFSDPAISSLLEAKSRARTGNNSNPIFDFLYGKANTVFDPRTGNMPDMSPTGLKNIKERQKLEKESLARAKQLAAFAKKQAADEKAKLLLLKAQKALASSSKVFDIDLIQNIAALQGKLTDDEILRLQTQQAILLDNAELAAKLSQKLLTAQIDATILASKSPFDAWTTGAILALEAMIKLREEIGKLSKPVLSAGEQLLANDYIDVLNDANDPSFSNATSSVNDFLSSLSNMPKNSSSGNYQDAFARPNADRGFTATELRIFIDPSAAALGINAASVAASANGNQNNYSTIQSFKGGTGL